MEKEKSILRMLANKWGFDGLDPDCSEENEETIKEIMEDIKRIIEEN